MCVCVRVLLSLLVRITAEYITMIYNFLLLFRLKRKRERDRERERECDARSPCPLTLQPPHIFCEMKTKHEPAKIFL